MPSKKSRAFDCVLYCPEEFLISRLGDLWDKIEWYAWIKHECDPIDPSNVSDGLKKAHIHLVLRTRSPLLITTIRNWFYYKKVDEEGNIISVDKVIAEYCYNPVGACRYLMHLDDPTKYQYDRSLVHTNKEDFDNFILSEDTEIDVIKEIVQLMLDGWDSASILEKYGKYYVIYRRQIDQTVTEIKRDRATRLKWESYAMEVKINDWYYHVGNNSEAGK